MDVKKPREKELLSNKSLKQLADDGRYYDNLHELCEKISIADQCAMDGCQPRVLKRELSSVFSLFLSLCEENVIKQGKGENDPQEEPQTSPKRPGNFVFARANWLRCPACGTRMVKVDNTTVIRNLPAYCKRCKHEVIVSWWK